MLNKIVIRNHVLFFLMCLSFACSSSKNINRDFVYLQRGLDSLSAIQLKENIIKVNDVIGIQVSSKSRNQEQAALFNLPVDASSGVGGYQVSSAGSIDLPVLGYIKVAGLTKTQLQTLLTERLSSYVKDPLVLVRFLVFNVNVLGEVRSPGTRTFQSDKVSIFDVISASGDMTDFGKKEDVVVIREENGKRSYYSLDLRSGGVFQSPAYLMQPNDIVYVQPNNLKLKQINLDPNRQYTQRNIFGYISIAVGLISLVVSLIRS